MIKLLFLIMTISLIAQEQKSEIDTTSINKNKSTEKIISEIVSNMVLVEGGVFQMGDFTGLGRDNERPVHPVLLDDYFISKYEVTFEQYDQFCEESEREKPNDKGWGRGKNPAINILWEDAVEFCLWVSKKTGKNFRLPTEAEWEFAARERGKKNKYSGTDDLAQLDNYAWYNINSELRIRPVGEKLPNELGLYDMSGNAMEWCGDWYDDNYYSQSPVLNPQGPETGTNHVLRGGSCYYYENLCRTINRDGRKIPSYWYNLIGFRLVMDK